MTFLDVGKYLNICWPSDNLEQVHKGFGKINLKGGTFNHEPLLNLSTGKQTLTLLGVAIVPPFKF